MPARRRGRPAFVWRLAARGLRYTLADWQREERLKSGKTKIVYAGGGKTGEAREELERPFWDWFEAGKTAEQTIGRLMVALAAARYAIDDVVPASRRHWLRLPAGKDDKAAKALERLAGGQLPASLARARSAIDAHTATEVGCSRRGGQAPTQSLETGSCGSPLDTAARGPGASSTAG